MKISILTPDFSNNCLARSWLLAKVLQRHYTVEILGPAFSNGIWKPLENACDFDIKIVKGYANGRFEFKKMLSLISGDVVYANKPLIASFGVGLVKKIKTRKPLVLDMDDWELGFGKEFFDSLIWPKKINDFRLSISNWRSFYYALILNKLIRFANELTVSGRTLQAKYRGTIICHGRDVHTLNPQHFNKRELKRKYLPDKDDKSFVVGFIGSPRPHKGLEDFINAMALLRSKSILFMIVGLTDDSYCINLKRKVDKSLLKETVAFFPEQPFDNLPDFLSITDLVVIPQRQRPTSYGQVPAKIFDAMAMAKPIIATAIFDIPDILNGCGWTVEPENPKQIAEAIEYIFTHPDEAKKKGELARQKCKKQYSWEVMEESLISIFDKYV